MSERTYSVLWTLANITFACSFLTVIGGGLTYIWGSHDLGGKIALTGALFFVASIVTGMGIENPSPPLKEGGEMRVLVCGGRRFNDALTLGSWLGGLHKNNGPITLLIEGGAPGADFMARKFAEWQKIPVQTFDADWGRYGKKAGPLRNRQMIDEGKPDLVVAFEGGKGTANMISQAQAAGIRVVMATKITTPH